MSDTERGLYRKYSVVRIDGKAKHDNCEYFVLDMTHDPLAVPALCAYADAASAAGYYKLARDLYLAASELDVRELHAESSDPP